jgi:hypothetical protein
MVRYLGAAGKAARYLGTRADSALYLGADSLWPAAGAALTFDPATTDPAITLSNGNRTAANGGGGGELIPANTSLILRGKKYIEVTINQIAFNNSSQGVGLSAGAKGEETPYVAIFSPENSSGAYLIVNGELVGQYAAGTYWFNTVVVSLAYDADAQTVMFCVNGGSWTSAISTASVGADLLLWCNIVLTNDRMTINGGSSAFAFTPPTGYSGPEV